MQNNGESIVNIRLYDHNKDFLRVRRILYAGLVDPIRDAYVNTWLKIQTILARLIVIASITAYVSSLNMVSFLIAAALYEVILVTHIAYVYIIYANDDVSSMERNIAVWHDPDKSDMTVTLVGATPHRDVAIAVSGIVSFHGTPELVHVSTDNTFRRMGIASKLMIELMSMAAKKEIPSVSFTTTTGHSNARIMYEKLGFRHSKTLNMFLGAIFHGIRIPMYVKYMKHLDFY